MRSGLVALTGVAVVAAAVLALAACGGSASETPPPLEPEPPPTAQTNAAPNAAPYVVKKGEPVGDAGVTREGGAPPYSF